MMKKRMTFRTGIAGILVSALMVVSQCAHLAAQPKLPGLPGRDSGAQAEAAAPGAKAPAKKSDGSEFVIPENATPDQLFEMANKLLNTEQTFDTEEEYNAWVQKMIQTVYTVANRILKMDVDDETYVKAIALKGQMLYYHVWAKPESFPKYEEFVRTIQKDPLLLKAEGGQR